jgi:hypothetical protein
VIVKESEIKILNIFILNDDIDFITADGKSRMMLHRISPSGDRVALKSFTVGMNTQFTCALLVANTLIVGDTRGNMLLFNYTKDHKEEQKPYQIHKVHQYERVISLFFDGQFLYSTSKDNFINQYVLVYE